MTTPGCKTRLIITLALVIAMFSACGKTAAWDTVVQPVEVARLPTYTEGVVVDHEGNLYVSHADRISRVTPDGRVGEWGTTPSPNGHKILGDGTHLVGDRKGAVYLMSASGEVINIAAQPEFGVNDLTLDTPNGGFYFTSPYASRTEPRGTVYYSDAEGTLHVVAENLGYPNGIVLRPDGKSLLVGESLYNRVIEFPVETPGKVGAFRIFAELPPKGDSDLDAKPDGMALDEAGNLYVAHYGTGRVRVLDPAGELVASLPGAGIFTSNVAFAGPEMNSLYVTGSIGPTEQTAGMLVRLDLPWVKGLRVLPSEN